jgi:hypothetical protein
MNVLKTFYRSNFKKEKFYWNLLITKSIKLSVGMEKILYFLIFIAALQLKLREAEANK